MNNYNTKQEKTKVEIGYKEILGINDDNITLDNKYKEEKVNGIMSFIFSGELSYKNKCCKNPDCKSKKTLSKNGYNTVRITMLKLSEKNTYLDLRKQKFICKECKKKVVAQTKLVKENSNISTNVRMAVLNSLTKIKSFKEIAENYNISTNSVIRILESCKNQVDVNKYKDLPEHLCFDEIKSTKDSKNGMSFVFMNALTHEFIDIVDGRTQHILNDYFLRFKRSVKNKVKTICIDIYPPYMEVIKRHFPNAEIIIDRFHIVQNLNRELNKTRVKLMNKFKGQKGSNYTIF